MTELRDYKTFIPVSKASAVNNREIDVLFANGTRSRIDLSDIIGSGPWKRLANPAFFSRAHAAYDTIVWTDDVDIAPEDVWRRARESATAS